MIKYYKGLTDQETGKRHAEELSVKPSLFA